MYIKVTERYHVYIWSKRFISLLKCFSISSCLINFDNYTPVVFPYYAQLNRELHAWSMLIKHVTLSINITKSEKNPWNCGDIIKIYQLYDELFIHVKSRRWMNFLSMWNRDVGCGILISSFIITKKIHVLDGIKRFG